MSEKLCVFCKNLDTRSWGSDSMGEWVNLCCEKGYFDSPNIVHVLRENILRAETCPDYEQVKP